MHKLVIWTVDHLLEDHPWTNHSSAAKQGTYESCCLLLIEIMMHWTTLWHRAALYYSMIIIVVIIIITACFSDRVVPMITILILYVITNYWILKKILIGTIQNLVYSCDLLSTFRTKSSYNKICHKKNFLTVFMVCALVDLYDAVCKRRLWNF